MSEKKVLSKREQTRQMTLLAMFIAIIAVLGLVPNGLGGTLGFIKIAPTIEATIIHIPVLIGAVLFGRKMGIYLGLAFGVVSNVAAFLYASPLLIYPWVAVLPRLVFGFLIYDVTVFFIKVLKNRYLGIGVSFFILTLIHTILVLVPMWTAFAIYMSEPLLGSLDGYIAMLFTFNVLPFTPFVEAGIAALVGALIVVRLARFLKSNDEQLVKLEVE